MDKINVLVTGGAGFIGSALVRRLILEQKYNVLNIDAMTYAVNPEALASVEGDDGYQLVELNIVDKLKLEAQLSEFEPQWVFHLAAESHVDNSIDDPSPFVMSNVIGTFNVLEACRKYFKGLSSEQKNAFRLMHISTDEVYGDIEDGGLFTESTPYAPSSPYSASKAASDHFIRSWFRTYDLPVLISNCSNNYGPFQNDEKLIPTVIRNAISCQPIPVYGDGLQIRDWLYVEDHVDALLSIIESGKTGESYNVGGNNELTNLALINLIVDELKANKNAEYDLLNDDSIIEFIQDRPGHDRRYAIDSSKLKSELGWSPAVSVEQGVRKTVRWYVSYFMNKVSVKS